MPVGRPGCPPPTTLPPHYPTWRLCQLGSPAGPGWAELSKWGWRGQAALRRPPQLWVACEIYFELFTIIHTPDLILLFLFQCGEVPAQPKKLIYLWIVLFLPENYSRRWVDLPLSRHDTKTVLPTILWRLALNIWMCGPQNSQCDTKWKIPSHFGSL